MLRAVLSRQLRGCLLAAPRSGPAGLPAAMLCSIHRNTLVRPGAAHRWLSDETKGTAVTLVRAVEEDTYVDPAPSLEADAAGQAPGEAEPAYSQTKVFVTNMAWETNDDDLQTHFSSIGPVSQARVFKEPDTGRSKGRGLVEFVNSEDARVALDHFNESDLNGRNIRVGPWQDRPPRQDRPSRQSYGPRGGEGRQQRGFRRESAVDSAPQELKLFVSNLSYNSTQEMLREHFGEVGPVRHVEIFTKAGRHAGMGIVVMESPDDVQQAIATLHESELDGRLIFVREDVPREARSAPRRSIRDADIY